MKIVQLDEKQITGISIRTNNANEANPETTKIGALHQQFDKNVTVNYKNGARVYGVYYNYESDHNGEFSVMAGADQVENSSTVNLESVSLRAGPYMVFEAKGQVPQVVIETWMKVWEYFSKDDNQYQRAYTTDFEYFKNQTEIEIYIAVKPK